MSKPARPAKWTNGGNGSLLAALHRTAGLLALAFVMILAGTGLLLNHAHFLGLDRHYLQSEALLDWYGIEAPRPETGYPVNGGLLVLVEDRLYFNETLVADAVAGFAGAVALGSLEINAVALARGLLLLDDQGERLDLLSWPDEAALPLDAFGTSAGSGLPAARFGETWYAPNKDLTRWWTDEGLFGVSARGIPLTDEQGKALQRRYRGSVLTWERVLLDLHSGRVLRGAGVWLADATAVALLLLGASGSVIWFLRRRRGR